MGGQSHLATVSDTMYDEAQDALCTWNSEAFGLVPSGSVKMAKGQVTASEGRCENNLR